jgi:hypothetical protein
MFAHGQATIEASQLHVVARRRLARFHQQKTQKRTALLADPPQLLAVRRCCARWESVRSSWLLACPKRTARLVPASAPWPTRHRPGSPPAAAPSKVFHHGAQPHDLPWHEPCGDSRARLSGRAKPGPCGQVAGAHLSLAADNSSSVFKLRNIFAEKPRPFSSSSSIACVRGASNSESILYRPCRRAFSATSTNSRR